MHNPYTMVIQWSALQQSYVVFLPDFEGIVHQPCATGHTFAEAAHHGQQALHILIEHLEDCGLALPAPKIYPPALQVA
ncbi:type II toxin-antitoxin system HicB family antitoxin [Alkalinema pantanalense CENA528]|uniref:type II toxin-antitoxin system HicB family antitoxin n=1 Tax=Alkalinema pantanalense TaxID=1620705 RepID=UPI003D6E1655